MENIHLERSICCSNTHLPFSVIGGSAELVRKKIACYFTFSSQNRLFIPKFTLFVLLSCIDQLISATTTDCVVRTNFPTHQCWRVKKLLTLGLLKEGNCGFATAMIKLTKTSRYIKRPDSGQGTTVLH